MKKEINRLMFEDIIHFLKVSKIIHKDESYYRIEEVLIQEGFKFIE